MRNIVVVEPVSTGFNFIRDIANRNFRPVILDMDVLDNEDNVGYDAMFKEAYSKIDVDYDLVHVKDTYEETLEMIREYDPLLVLAGAEYGVIYATRLANDLGLKCNPIENLDAMTFKDKMQEKIAESGLRHIRGRVVKSVEEAIEYYDESGFDEVVVKPVYSAGSVGVRICLNKEEMIKSLTERFNDVNMYGEEVTEMVVQERINGEEYFVNTVSCDGNHRVTLMWKYNKVKTAEGGHIYDSINTVYELGLGEAEIVEYAYDVADALGIRYGPVHGEYMVDEKGPVLIEVNCRPAGGNMDAEYLDRISGQHETDSILDAYLNPENFFYERDRGYKLYAHGSLKLFIVPKDILAQSSPMKYISNRLKSHYKTTQEINGDTQLFVKTQDFETTGGTVYLVHEDGYVLQKDLDFLRSVEKYAFDLVLSEGSDKKIIVDDDEALDEVKSTLERVRGLGSTLFVTDQRFDVDNVLQVSPDDLDEVKGEFNCVVVNLNKSLVDLKDDMIAYLFLRIIDRVKVGGIIFIPESTYQFIPHGRIGAEALIKVFDLKLELPLHNLKNMVIASKN
ncbi:hypothetical protein TL18_04325 [Methanobrevibacter sp. YE315]|uniref:ATP-grasp domain-containing protein n=1 Tax=Methanobrevibacter sp. YE315 TaxID=1609968 RepID=UPI000764DA9B|nr:ATP-grasp domain-containing protein [Methanobrevibacter sp. YE315]AMD17316.1 hypothetical protein TL18_04325 [Methanobrevibacter sp. YE315]